MTTPTVPAPPSQPGLLVRLKAFSVDLLPDWLVSARAHGLLGMLAIGLLVFLAVMLMPALSVRALALARGVLPSDIGDGLSKVIVGEVHRGYGIEDELLRLKSVASADARRQLDDSNTRFDYIQYFELDIEPNQTSRSIPIRLAKNQQARLDVMKVLAILQRPGAPGSVCETLAAMADLPEVLDVKLGGVMLASLPKMDEAAGEGRILFDREWWARNGNAVARGGPDDPVRLTFAKAQGIQTMRGAPCMSVRVAAALAVSKVDVAASVTEGAR